VDQPVTDDSWRIFVHFADANRATDIKFQNDQQPNPVITQWPKGVVEQGPFTLTVPEHLTGTLAIRMGLFKTGGGMPRAQLPGAGNDQSVLVGRLKIAGDQIAFEPPPPATAPPDAGDPALFVRADHGWAEGRHPMDRFMKNTYELLSPLYELTAQIPMSGHRFLSRDRTVQRSEFGAITVTANKGGADYPCQTRWIGSVTLPPYGLVIEADTFAAYCVSQWQNRKYPQPVLFTVRSMDNQPLSKSGKIKVFSGFGEPGAEVAESIRK
jgi:hypothetical protein